MKEWYLTILSQLYYFKFLWLPYGLSYVVSFSFSWCIPVAFDSIVSQGASIISLMSSLNNSDFLEEPLVEYI